jgi:hypothetical protein
VTNTFDSLPSDLGAAHALILAEQAARRQSEARAARAEADLSHAHATASSAEALIARLKLEIEKLRRTLFGARSERKERLVDQLEMQLEDVEADATEDELAAERSTPSTVVKPFECRRPARKPLPEHLPRERVVIPAPQSCPCCGSTKLSKLGEDVTETLEVIPRQWKMIQTVRERFSCRQCQAIMQPPAPRLDGVEVVDQPIAGRPKGLVFFIRPARGPWARRDPCRIGVAVARRGVAVRPAFPAQIGAHRVKPAGDLEPIVKPPGAVRRRDPRPRPRGRFSSKPTSLVLPPGACTR